VIVLTRSALQTSGTINVNQTLLAKPAAGHSSLPLSRVNLYLTR